MQSSKLGMRKVLPFVNRRYTKGVTFLWKKGIQKDNGLDPGEEFPRLNFLDFPSTPGSSPIPR